MFCCRTAKGNGPLVLRRSGEMTVRGGDPQEKSPSARSLIASGGLQTTATCVSGCAARPDRWIASRQTRWAGPRTLPCRLSSQPVNWQGILPTISRNHRVDTNRARAALMASTKAMPGVAILAAPVATRCSCSTLGDVAVPYGQVICTPPTADGRSGVTCFDHIARDFAVARDAWLGTRM